MEFFYCICVQYSPQLTDCHPSFAYFIHFRAFCDTSRRQKNTYCAIPGFEPKIPSIETPLSAVQTTGAQLHIVVTQEKTAGRGFRLP